MNGKNLHLIVTASKDDETDVIGSSCSHMTCVTCVAPAPAGGFPDSAQNNICLFACLGNGMTITCFEYPWVKLNLVQTSAVLAFET